MISNIKSDFNEGLSSILKDMKDPYTEEISLSVLKIRIDFSRLNTTFNLLMEKIIDFRKMRK